MFAQNKHRSGSDPAFNAGGFSEVYNNAFLMNKGFIDNFGKMVDTVNAQTIKVHDNFWGMTKFSADKIFQAADFRANNTQEVFRIFVQVSNNHISFTNNTSDNTKTGQLTGTAAPQMDSSGNKKVAFLPFPRFNNTGASALGISDSLLTLNLAMWVNEVYATHGDEYNILNCGKATCCGVRQCTPWTYAAGDIVVWLGKIYVSRQNGNQGNMPYPGDNTWWRLISWTNTRSGGTTTTPPDDLRLIQGDFYQAKGMGISAIVVPQTKNFFIGHYPFKPKFR
jgi:hypothetical protein